MLEDRVAGCSVSVDDVVGGALAVRHLTATGHRTFAYVSGPSHLQQVRDRREGALLALAEAGLPASALRQPAVTLGAKAAELLLEESGDRAAGHRHERVVLQPELVVRRSTLAGP